MWRQVKIRSGFRSILYGAAAACVALAACHAPSDEPNEPPMRFAGLVTDVAARTLLEFETIEVTDANGRAMVFHANGGAFDEFTPSHIREHMLLGEPVEVGYRAEGGRLIIVSLRDSADARLAPSDSP